MKGSEIKKMILSSGVRLWEVAQKWGITDSNFSRRLRKPFNENEVLQVKIAIDEIKQQKAVECSAQMSKQ